MGNRAFIGVDPGRNGGFAVLSGASVLDADSLDTTDGPSVREAFAHASAAEGVTGVVVGIEAVSAMVGWGTRANHVLGLASGVVRGVAVGMLIPVIDVHPDAWRGLALAGKRTLHPDRKRAVWIAARERWPNVVPDSLRRGSGVADALWIALWLQTKGGIS